MKIKAVFFDAGLTLFNVYSKGKPEMLSYFCSLVFDKGQLSKLDLILKAIGEDCNRQGLQNTPKRIAKMYEEIFAGINVNLEDQIQVAFDEKHQGIGAR